MKREDFLRLFAATPTSERLRSEWVMSQETAYQARLVKDLDGRYIFSPSMTVNSPYEGLILDLPVRIDESAIGISLAPAS